MLSTDAVRDSQVKERKYKRNLSRSLAGALAADLNRLLSEEQQVDLTLCLSTGVQIRAHKAVLQARVPYLLQGHQANASILHLPEEDPAVVRELLRKAYTEESSLQSHAHTNGSVTVEEDGELYPGAVRLEPASGLGADLLALYEGGALCDINIQVGERVFSAHRAVLCARCPYFKAMLCGGWMESSQSCITLQGLGPDEMELLLHFMYGAIIDLPPGTNVSQVVLAADMLGLEGLKEVGEMVLIRDYCRFFPKPGEGVQRSILECLAISHSISLHNLHTSCIRWIAEHFVKCWSERNFAVLPHELQRECFNTVTKNMTVQTVISVLCGTEQLIGSLPEVKWAKQVELLTKELQEECLSTIVTHLPRIIHTTAFHNFRRREEFTRDPTLLGKVCAAVREGVSVENCCELFSAVDQLCGLTPRADKPMELEIQEQEELEPWRKEVFVLRTRLWTFLLQSFFAVRHTRGWETLPLHHRECITTAAVDKGDCRRLSKKPVLTSSQKLVKCPSGSASACESPRPLKTPYVPPPSTAKNRAVTKNMKSESLGTNPGLKTKPGPSSLSQPNSTSPAKRKAASSAKAVLNDSNDSGTPGENSPVNGSTRNTTQEKRLGTSTRVKTTSTGMTGAGRTAKTFKATASGKDLSHGSTRNAVSTTSPTSSASPEALRSNPQSKASARPAVNKPVPKAEPQTSSTTNKANRFRNTASSKSSISSSAAARTEVKNKSSTSASSEDHVSAKPAAALSFRKAEERDGSKVINTKKPTKTRAESKPSTESKPSAKALKPSTGSSKMVSVTSNKSCTKPKALVATATKSSSKPSSPAASKKPAASEKDLKSSSKSPSSSQPSDLTQEVKRTEQEGGSVLDKSSTAPVYISPEQPGSLQDYTDHHADVPSLAAKNCGTLPVLVSQEVHCLEPPTPVTEDAGGATGSPTIPSQEGSHIQNTMQEKDCPPSTPCSVGSIDTPLESWIRCRVSPESETGSATTSSDDIKPRSEDYDAGGSQDDDGCSHDRAASKCGTMRCPDFLGRSSSDTSTPEELKMYEGGSGLRVEVRLRGREAEATSDEEAVRQRWIGGDKALMKGESLNVDQTGVLDHQLCSSEEEEEEDSDAERSEVEVVPPSVEVTPNAEEAPQFQGIVNPAFEDAADQENDFQPGSSFRRSVLLSVDECEEMGSEDPGNGEVFESQNTDSEIPCNVKTHNAVTNGTGVNYTTNTHDLEKTLQHQEPKTDTVITEPQEPQVPGQSSCLPSDKELNHDPPQERPGHLDLHLTEPCITLQFRHVESKRAELRLDLPEAQVISSSPVHPVLPQAGNV